MQVQPSRPACHRPTDGTRVYETRRLRFNSSRWYETRCSSGAEHVGDNHVVAGAIPAIETICSCPRPWMGRDAAKVAGEGSIPSGGTPRAELAATVCPHRSAAATLRPPFTSPSGTSLVSKTGQQCSIHWWRALPGSSPDDSGPPCGVTAAGSSLAI